MNRTLADLAGEPRSIERGGCRVGYRIAGEEGPALLLFSAWQIVHSGVWKAQVPYLSRYARVIAVDCRGNGLSGRPEAVEDYSPWQLVADAAAVLDAERIERAIVGGFSYGGHLAALFAARHPERTRGAILIAPASPFGPRLERFAKENLLAERERYEGWEKYNFHYWREHFPDFAEFFVRQVFPEPHSEKQIEDGIAWALETDGETMMRTVAARADRTGQCEEAYRSVRCPVLVMHGTEDRIIPHATGERVAELTGARFVSLEGSGHMPGARIPARINRLIREFIAEVDDTEPVTAPKRASRRERRPRALYLSSPIGLGHVRRDKAIADAVRRLRPELEIDWLAQDPVTRVLEAAGERVHPVSARLLSESRHIEEEAGEHDLHAFEALRRMDAILVANFCHFQDAVDTGEYDLVIADEAWDIDRFWHEHPELKRAKLAWMTDFVGMLALPDAPEREARLAADWNAEMIGFVEGRPDVRDAALFVGDPEDVVELPFGAGLPSIREWTGAHFGFPGYVDPFEGLARADRETLRAELGYASDETVCLVAVGGSGVGAALIRRLADAAPRLRARRPGLRFEIVVGPRLDPARFAASEGVRFHAYLPDFLRHAEAADVAIVQGGLSTTMELTCLGTPFLYVPLEAHFEQQIHVHHRLARYGVGRRLGYAELLDTDHLTAELESLIAAGRVTPRRVVAPGAAERAAGVIAGLV